MLDVLEGALRYAGRMVAGIRDGQRAAPTPCADYPVEALTAHLVQGITWFGGLPGGGSTDPRDVPDPDLRDTPLAAAFDAAATRARSAWADADLDRTFAMFGTEVSGAQLARFLVMEALGHGWDLAVATGQPADADADLAERALRMAHELGPDLRLPGMMAEPVPVPADAPATDRLVGFLGRDPVSRHG